MGLTEEHLHKVVDAPDLRINDLVLVEAGETIPGDGEVVEGVASVNESAITGESAPVIRESGGDRSAVTGGTLVLSDWLVIRISSNPGESFLDRMIAMVEGAKRQKTPNEIALDILLAGLTIIFLLATATLLPYSIFSTRAAGQGHPVTLTVLVSLLVCLIPTTIGGLLSAIGIAGMDRMIQANVIATSGRAVEAAGDVDVLLLDKTGTITLGNRQAVAFLPAEGVDLQQLADAARQGRVRQRCRSTPSAGRKATACRLPRVMVPVLSSSSTSTSPAASTARPDMAMTLAWIMRSMPAMPMAREQPADGGRDEAHEQRDKHRQRHGGRRPPWRRRWRRAAG